MAQQYYQKSTNVWHSSAPDFKVGDKVFVKAKFFQTTQPSKKLSKKYLGLYKIIAQSGTLSFTLHLPESMCSVYPVFHMFMLEPATSNSFSKRTQLAPASVIIDRVIDSKIDCWWACKLLYKVIWLEYEDTRDESKWILISKLMPLTWYLISISHILSSSVFSHCPDHTITFVLCLHIFPMGIFFTNSLVYSVCLFSLTLSFHTLFEVSFQNFQTSFHFISWLSYSHI